MASVCLSRWSAIPRDEQAVSTRSSTRLAIRGRRWSVSGPQSASSKPAGCRNGTKAGYGEAEKRIPQLTLEGTMNEAELNLLKPSPAQAVPFCHGHPGTRPSQQPPTSPVIGTAQRRIRNSNQRRHTRAAPSRQIATPITPRLTDLVGRDLVYGIDAIAQVGAVLHCYHRILSRKPAKSTSPMVMR